MDRTSSSIVNFPKLATWQGSTKVRFHKISWKMLWTIDKVVRLMFWGGVSALLATVLSVLGIMSCVLAFTTLWLFTASMYMYTANMKEPVVGKAVVVTGCDSGFGNTLALHLDKLGFKVFAACLHAEGEGAQHLRQEGSINLHVLQMDVTKQDQVDKAAEEVKRLLPKGCGVWGLVNNAGVCTLGPVEWVSLESFRRDPEVNIFGLIAVTKTFLPLVRRAKGRVVNVASVAGRMSARFMGPYCISKYAVEGFSDALRQEMYPFGVDVCILEPGNFANGTFLFATDEKVEQEVETLWAALDDQRKEDYGQLYCKKVEGFKKNFRRKGAKDISPVINAFTEALTQTHPQDRYCPMEPRMYAVAFISNHFPAWVYDGVVRLLAVLLLKKDEV
ncbi:D-beta-hydroxybutyrate dehydrogenase, mitochondrial isoform X2 [Cherax quadricarinatus]|uniref:D-beta-hydroxybutyrate dehydrogenase, mitochondrial isoform X2 n=1 Tax=Cherax quadricarinatus TaxID=27406 RepID=UPI00387E6F3C